MQSDRPSTNREIFASVQERAKSIGHRQELGLTGARAGWVGYSRVPGRTEDEFAADVYMCAVRTLGQAQFRLYRLRSEGANDRLLAIAAGTTIGEVTRMFGSIDDMLGAAYRESGLWPVSRYFDGTPAPQCKAVEIRACGLRPPLFGESAWQS